MIVFEAVQIVFLVACFVQLTRIVMLLEHRR